MGSPGLGHQTADFDKPSLGSKLRPIHVARQKFTDSCCEILTAAVFMVLRYRHCRGRAWCGHQLEDLGKSILARKGSEELILFFRRRKPLPAGHQVFPTHLGLGNAPNQHILNARLQHKLGMTSTWSTHLLAAIHKG